MPGEHPRQRRRREVHQQEVVADVLVKPARPTASSTPRWRIAGKGNARARPSSRLPAWARLSGGLAGAARRGEGLADGVGALLGARLRRRRGGRGALQGLADISAGLARLPGLGGALSRRPELRGRGRGVFRSWLLLRSLRPEVWRRRSSPRGQWAGRASTRRRAASRPVPPPRGAGRDEWGGGGAEAGSRGRRAPGRANSIFTGTAPAAAEQVLTSS